MIASQFLLAGFLAAVSASSLHAEEALFASLLKRQEPGTPAYNCHDNCGTAITISRLPNPCDNEAFKTNYNNCLQCAGPDNYNIWRYYGRTLTTAGTTCGLETTPKSGEQAEVGPAVQAGSSSSAAVESTSSAVAVEASTAIPSTTAAPVSSEGPASAAPATTSVAVLVSSVIATSEVSGVPSRSLNATASFTASAPAEVSTNAAASLGFANAGVFGAVFVGALFGF